MEADDSQRFILEHFDAISNSPSQIYHSALPFAPSKSWLRECYSSEFSQEVKVVKGLQAEWGACPRTVHSDHGNLYSVASKNGIILVGLATGNIVALDAITGSRLSVLFEHDVAVQSVAFSADGKSFVSGSIDKTVKLWDMQTGGVVKTFHGHTATVRCVSISPDMTRIASGSRDTTIRLWDIQKGECCYVIEEHDSDINTISFSPINPNLFISASDDDIIQQWDINGQRVGPAHYGHHVVFSSDGTRFMSWDGEVAAVQNTNSGLVVTKLQVTSSQFSCCCFSPDDKFIAGGVGDTVYIWDITGSEPCLIRTFVGHARLITSIAFSSPSSLVSTSWDQTVKFWEIGASLMDPITTSPTHTPLTSALIQSITVWANDGIAISGDAAGMIRIWDLLTGLCKLSFPDPAPSPQRDVRLIDGRLIVVWHADHKIHIWDVEKEELIQAVDAPWESWILQPKISGDGSKIFLLDNKCIRAWSIWTGEVVGMAMVEDMEKMDKKSRWSLIVEGSRVWMVSEDIQTQGWDFGVPGSTPIQLSSTSLDENHPDLINCTRFWSQWGTDLPPIKDTVTGKDIFQLYGKHARPTGLWCDGHYLVAGYGSGEVLILDFNHMIPQ